MKAVLLSPRKGVISVADIPPPVAGPGMVLIQNEYSLISAGTERATVATGSQSLVGKARHRPDQVKLVLDAVRTNGLRDTLRMVQDRLDRPMMLGYSSAGTVLAVGPGVPDISPGMRVAAAGAGFASHAEIVSVPRNLVVPVPDAVDLRWAAFSTVGAIALQGIHQAECVPGSRIAVIGLGLVGQLTMHLLRAYGYDAVGIDSDPQMIQLATRADLTALARDTPNLESLMTRRWGGREADAVIITAATRSPDPIELAGRIARDRAAVVIVGDVAVTPPRSTYYHKELEIRYSRSYGPGRYDVLFEEGGEDYPEGYVPWTERRNLSEVLRLVQVGKLRIDALEPQVFPIGDASAAYAALSDSSGGRHIALLFHYPGSAATPRDDRDSRHPAGNVATWQPASRTVRVASIGAGNFAARMLFPPLQKSGQASFAWVSSGRGLSAVHQARRWGFEAVVDDATAGLALGTADAAMVVSRHDSHADYAVQVLEAGLALFCEKPLALTEPDLERIAQASAASGAPAMVGFNRRFAPAIKALKHALPPQTPAQVVYRVFAGRLPADHWYFDVRQGGRLLGEVCHFIDTAGYLIGARPASVVAHGVDASDPVKAQDVSLLLTYDNGSTALITYGGRTPAGAPKELIEVAAEGFAARIDDFETLRMWSGGKEQSRAFKGKPKGHDEEMAAFLRMARGEVVPEADFGLALWSSLATCRAAAAVASGTQESVSPTTPCLSRALDAS